MKSKEFAVHPFAPGEKALIYQLRLCARPMIEGEATIIDRVAETSGLYRVKFKHEPQPVMRLVHAGPWQSHPECLLAELMAHWRASIAPEAFGLSLGDIPDLGAATLTKR